MLELAGMMGMPRATRRAIRAATNLLTATPEEAALAIAAARRQPRRPPPPRRGLPALRDQVHRARGGGAGLARLAGEGRRRPRFAGGLAGD